MQTVAVVGSAAAGMGGGLLAGFVAFAPSFVLALGGARRFSALRRNRLAQTFLTGAGPATIGAIAGSAIPLALSLSFVWQFGVPSGATGPAVRALSCSAKGASPACRWPR